MHTTLQKKDAPTTKKSQPFFSPSFIQPKLTIGAPNDKYEQEADSMADKVMRMSQDTPAIQTKCAGCEQEEKMQMKPMVQKMGGEEEEMMQTKPLIQKMRGEEEEMMQTKPILQKMGGEEEETLQTKPLMLKSEGGGGVATQALTTQLNSSKGSGSSLPASTNSFMSQAFGSNFSNVKVHTDSNAIQMNQGLNAKAFTHGSDIYFNKGQYAPESSDGKKLLAHELTHVVQQRGRIHRQVTEYYNFDEDVVTGDVTDVGGTGEQEIDRILTDWKDNIDQFFTNFRDGLNNFETAMSFSSKQKAKANYLNAVIKATGTKLFTLAVDKIIPGSSTSIGLAVAALKSVIDEYDRARSAGGEVQISEFIQDLRASISPLQIETKDKIDVNRLKVMEEYRNSSSGENDEAHNKVVGGKARFIKSLRKNIENFKRVVRFSSPNYVQQRITEKFSLTDNFSGPVTQGGQSSGQLYLEAYIYLNDGEMNTESLSSSWKLLSDAPKVSNLADSLEGALRRRGLKPYQSNLEKNVDLTVETEIDWALNDYHDGRFHFTGRQIPNSPTLRGLGPREIENGYAGAKKLRRGWKHIKDRLKNITGISGGTTL